MRRGILLIGASLVLLLLPVMLRAQPNCQPIQTQGEAALAHVTPEEARRLAVRIARARAVEQVVGIELRAVTVVRDAALAGEFVRALTHGHVLQEKIISEEVSTSQEAPDQPPSIRYRVHLQACVAPQNGKRDPNFKVSATLNKDAFVAQEPASLEVQCGRACHLTILNLTADDRFRLLLPNAYQKTAHLQQSETYLFPSADSGLSLVMETLPGHNRDTEAFLVVATKQRFDALAQLGQGGEDIPMESVFATLLDLPADERAETLVAYEVRAR